MTKSKLTITSTQRTQDLIEIHVFCKLLEKYLIGTTSLVTSDSVAGSNLQPHSRMLIVSNYVFIRKYTHK